MCDWMGSLTKSSWLLSVPSSSLAALHPLSRQQDQPNSRPRLGRISLRSKQTKAEVQTKQKTRAKHIHIKSQHSDLLQSMRELPLPETLGAVTHPISVTPRHSHKSEKAGYPPCRAIFCGIGSLSSIPSHTVSLRQPVPNAGTKKHPWSRVCLPFSPQSRGPAVG